MMRLVIECDEQIASLNIEFTGGTSIISTKPKADLEVSESSERNHSDNYSPSANNTDRVVDFEDYEDVPVSTEELEKPEIDIGERESKVAEGMAGLQI